MRLPFVVLWMLIAFVLGWTLAVQFLSTEYSKISSKCSTTSTHEAALMEEIEVLRGRSDGNQSKVEEPKVDGTATFLEPKAVEESSEANPVKNENDDEMKGTPTKETQQPLPGLMNVFAGSRREEVHRRFPGLKFGYFMTTGCRPNGVRYYDRCIDALIDGKLNQDSFVLFSTEPGDISSCGIDEYLSRKRKSGFNITMFSREDFLRPSLLPKVLSSNKIRTSEGAKMANQDAWRRYRWRVNEALDFLIAAKVMMDRFPDSEWLIYLQDDALLKSNLYSVSRIESICSSSKKDILKLNKYGNVALAIRRSALEEAFPTMEENYDSIPIDWLVQQTIKGIAGSTEIFHHIGVTSSFENNPARPDTSAVKKPK